MSSREPDAVVDTVVLLYFLLVDRADLLLALLGGSIAVPRVVYDPDEGQVPETARSEVTRGIGGYERAASDRALNDEDRQVAMQNATRLSDVHQLHVEGLLAIVDMSPAELATVGRLTTAAGAGEHGLRFALDVGEAACVAIALERNWILVTDDSDALRVYRSLGGQGYERIRRLLRRAGEEGLIPKDLANSIHAEMRQRGFWDTGPPFP